VVLVQVTITAKSNEIPVFTPLLDAVEHVLGDLHGVLFVADAMHTHRTVTPPKSPTAAGICSSRSRAQPIYETGSAAKGSSKTTHTTSEMSHSVKTPHQATGPAVPATLRNTAIGYHHTMGDTNIARANRRANRRLHDLITSVTSSNPRTQ
jgi:hypothetical protein